MNRSSRRAIDRSIRVHEVHVLVRQSAEFDSQRVKGRRSAEEEEKRSRSHRRDVLVPVGALP
eukprot:COSAG02_NODE_38439_length_429_cov_0.627273_1_plen_61_part_01